MAPNTVHYAIGDVHGRSDLLETLYARIAAFHAAHHGARAATLVHLGDYIDGGPDSPGVIDRLMAGMPGFRSVCVRGNHEVMMLACLDTDERQVWWNWLGNGGDETLASLGLRHPLGGYDPTALARALGRRRIAWLRSLPVHYQAEGYLFVHAGIMPGRPLAEQEEHDLLWIRGRFLDSDADHGFRVVHGHTPADAPQVRPNRIGIDTGATSRGCLTAVVLERDGNPEPPRFLVAETARFDRRTR